VATALKPLEIMSAGRRRDNRGNWHEFTEADLEQIAASFSGAPFVPGHPDDDQPELGKATKAEFKDGRLLITDYEGVDATFKALVNSGELPGISVKLRLPGHPENPGDTPIIRHIGFLGRSLPADEGIAAAAFSAPEDHEIEFSVGAQGSAPTDPPDHQGDPMPTAQSSTSPQTSPAQGEGANQEAAFAQRQADLDAREAEFAQQQATFRRTQAITPVLNGYVADGKLLPGEVEGFTALFASLDDEHEIEFSQGDDITKVSAAAFLKDFLKGLPKRGPELGEVAPAKDAEFAQGETQPENTVAKTRAALNQKYRSARTRN
jgi:hypothetical protein